MTISTYIYRTRRRATLALLRLLAGRRGNPPPVDPATVRRVLLIRYDRIGDAVITTPFVKILHDLVPWAEIDILASPSNGAVFADDPRVASVVVWPRSIVGKLRAIFKGRSRRYDLVYLLILGKTTLPALIGRMITPEGRIIGRRSLEHDFLLDHMVELTQKHFADLTLAVVSGPFASTPSLDDVPYSLVIGEGNLAIGREMIRRQNLASGDYILMNISAGTPDRELSLEEYVEIATRLRQKGLTVAVTGSPSATVTIERIAKLSGASPLVSGSILIAAVFCKEAQVVITPDTATLHIASSVGRPTVALFGHNGNPAGWGPRGVPSVIIRREAAGVETSETIVERVVAAVTSLLGTTPVHPTEEL